MFLSTLYFLIFSFGLKFHCWVWMLEHFKWNQMQTRNHYNIIHRSEDDIWAMNIFILSPEIWSPNFNFYFLLQTWHLFPNTHGFAIISLQRLILLYHKLYSLCKLNMLLMCPTKIYHYTCARGLSHCVFYCVAGDPQGNTSCVLHPFGALLTLPSPTLGSS